MNKLFQLRVLSFILLIVLGFLVFANDTTKVFKGKHLDYEHEDNKDSIGYYYLPRSKQLEDSKDSIKYYQLRGDEDTLKIYSEPRMMDTKRFFGTRYHRWEKIFVYAETCIVEEADVVIIKCSDDKPLIILEQKEE